METEHQTWKTSILPSSETFKQNKLDWDTVLQDYEEKMGESRVQGRKEVLEKHKALGKLLPRERVEMLIDQDTPFLELMPLTGYGQEGFAVGGGTIAGVGQVCGVLCMIIASQYTIKGGTIDEMAGIKGGRIEQIVQLNFQENRLPVVTLLESGGANLEQQVKVFHKGGAAFKNITKRSKLGLPSITVVFGNCTAGGAYTPGMSDYVIMIKRQGQVFLGGPPLVKMATGEETDAETLGGAEMHSKISGVSDFLAENEPHALLLAREVVAGLDWYKGRPCRPFALPAEPPLYPADELLGVTPVDVRRPYDCREIIARIVDGSKFTEFKANYGKTLVTAWARVHGVELGIIGNNGVLFPDSSLKSAQFIQLCNQKSVPILFLQNITGFMVGKKYEQEGIIKAGAKLINAISNSAVPAITVIVGASYGAGNYGMCGRSYDPRFLFTWPNAKIAVMGVDQMVGVLDIVQRAGGKKVDEEVVRATQALMRERMEQEASAYYCTSRCIDDGIIDPRDTRAVLAFCLAVIYASGEVKGTNQWGVHRM